MTQIAKKYSILIQCTSICRKAVDIIMSLWILSLYSKFSQKEIKKVTKKSVTITDSLVNPFVSKPTILGSE